MDHDAIQPNAVNQVIWVTRPTSGCVWVQNDLVFGTHADLEAGTTVAAFNSHVNWGLNALASQMWGGPCGSVSLCEEVLVPDSISTGQTFDAWVRVRNRGNDSWLENVKLHAADPLDNNRWGVSAVSGNRPRVHPQWDQGFTIHATAPATAGTYNFAWQLVRDGVGAFGPICQKQINIGPGGPTITVTKTAQETTVAPNGLLHYRIRVQNTGGAAHQVYINDLVDPNVVDIVDYPSICGLTTLANNPNQAVIRCRVGEGGNSTLAAGAVKDIDGIILRVKPNLCTNGAQGITNAIVLEVLGLAPFNAASVTTPLQCAPTQSTLTIEKTPLVNSVNVGDNIPYRITIRNTGNAPATNVIVEDPIDTQLTPTGTYPGQCGLINVGSSNIIRCNLGTLAPGQVVNLEIHLRVPQQFPCGQSAINSARVRADGISVVMTPLISVPVNCPQSQFGCIDIVKISQSPSGAALPVVPQFEFRLDNNANIRVWNAANGHARFTNVPVGNHTVTEVIPSNFWQVVSISPSGGQVNVPTSSSCVTVTFTNRQVLPQSVLSTNNTQQQSGSNSSTWFWIPDNWGGQTTSTSTTSTNTSYGNTYTFGS
jgi:uncharacterized repeat protein (TIGR01451 family)